MKVTSYDLYEMGIADEIVKEPKGAAHISQDDTAQILKEVIIRNYAELKKLNIDDLINLRIEKYDKIGEYEEK